MLYPAKLKRPDNNRALIGQDLRSLTTLIVLIIAMHPREKVFKIDRVQPGDVAFFQTRRHIGMPGVGHA